MKPWIVPLLRWYYNDYDDTDNNADDNTVTMIKEENMLNLNFQPFQGKKWKHGQLSHPGKLYATIITIIIIVIIIIVIITIIVTIIITIIITMPMPAFGRQGLGWIVGWWPVWEKKLLSSHSIFQDYVRFARSPLGWESFPACQNNFLSHLPKLFSYLPK